jgi:inner membrane protein
MPTVFTHAVVGASISALGRPAGVRLGLVAAACAAAPDLDVIPLWLGVPWGHGLGHRGITHSLAFAAVLAGVVAATMFRARGRGRLGVWLVLFAATASHGLLDAMTDGGIGIAFFAPFDDGRFFLPWRPIPVSPISLGRFFSGRGAAVLRAEVLLIWGPAVLLALAAVWRRRRAAPRTPSPASPAGE